MITLTCDTSFDFIRQNNHGKNTAYVILINHPNFFPNLIFPYLLYLMFVKISIWRRHLKTKAYLLNIN